MSHRDMWTEQLIRDQLGSTNAVRQAYEQIIRQNQREFAALHGTAAEAAALAAREAIASLNLDHENIYRQIGLTQLQILKDLNIPLRANFAEIARQAITPLAQSMRIENFAAKIAKSHPRTDFAALARQTIRNLNLSTIGGNSIAAAYAALASEQAIGFESLRGSFAGIAADVLRQAMASLDEREEEAFAQFEKLIDTKIATLPRNEVTAESLLRFLLMLFIALGSLGAELVQIQMAEQSSKTQDEHEAVIMNALQRIATNTERLTSEEDKNVYYVVERTVDLRLKPRSTSPPITTIFRNQKTRLVHSKHQWIYVEYFDYLEGIPKYGWAKKKYLKRTPAGKTPVVELTISFPGIESRAAVMGGVPCIAQTRIPVWLLEQARRLGTNDDDLLRDYPTLTAQDLANAWNFVRYHRSEIDEQIEANEKDDD